MTGIEIVGDPRLALRIADHARPADNGGCWLWGLALTPKGYGRIKIRNRNVRAHRVSYEAFCGPIPSGMVIDHSCRVRHCVNPAHLEPVTDAENLRRQGPRRGRARPRRWLWLTPKLTRKMITGDLHGRGHDDEGA